MRTPNRYGGVTDAQLAAALAGWFDRHSATRDCWNRSEAGRLLKARLVALGAFRNKPRGDPAKGRAVMLRRRAAKANFAVRG